VNTIQIQDDAGDGRLRTIQANPDRLQAIIVNSYALLLRQRNSVRKNEYDAIWIRCGLNGRGRGLAQAQLNQDIFSLTHHVQLLDMNREALLILRG
jgi:hypothetical protein